MTRVLVTGRSGLLGPFIVDAATVIGEVSDIGWFTAGQRVDLTDPGAAKRLIDSVEPDVVLNCAALTDVDGCDSDPARAMAVNCALVKNLAAALPAESRLIQFSTDQVYPDAPGPHGEGCAAPVNVYGRSKLAGEEAALAHGNALVLRTNFFGRSRTPGRKSLSDWMIEGFSERRMMTLFVDSIFSPLHLTTVASLTVECVRKGLTGVYNLGCREGASKCDFGLAVAGMLGLQTTNAVAGHSTASPARAPRPKDLRMDVAKIEAALHKAMPAFPEEIRKLAEVAP